MMVDGGGFMNNAIRRFLDLPIKRKIVVVTAVLLTIALSISIPVYAWFSKQRKAAEMFKVQYPNSLYINAAHREDRIYFNLDGIDVNNYLYNPDGTPQKDEHGNALKVTKYRYVFAVSGDNTEEFTLQMAHTNNNMFTYTIYPATQYDYPAGTQVQAADEETGQQEIKASQIVPAGTVDSRIVEWTQHVGGHAIDKAIQVAYDEYTDKYKCRGTCDSFLLAGRYSSEG